MAGAERSGRPTEAVRLAVTVMVAESLDEADFVRAQIAFYASTPSYRPVMAHHGWGEVADRLRTLARAGQLGDMPALIGDEMLRTFAVIAPAQELASALQERYAGLADRLSLYMPFAPGARDDFWRKLASDLRDL
jgi:alkanesulfonate monooxygenase SsuD/methylene tetrahydromethanopterin reductase-like flavin-dependent oxidoreductase (luciferase family)